MMKKIMGVPKVRYIIYLVAILLGICVSIISVIMGFIYTNSIINYFLGFSASLIITSLFAYILDIISNKELSQNNAIKRSLYIIPIKTRVNDLLEKVSMLASNGNDCKIEEYKLDNFAEAFNYVFNDYCALIARIVSSKPYEQVNAAFNIKNQIERNCLDELKKNLDYIFENIRQIIIDRLFTNKELMALKDFKRDLGNVFFPYLDILGVNKHMATSEIDWPKAPVSPLVIQNFIKRANSLQNSICNLVKEIKELQDVLDFVFIPHNLSEKK